MYLCTKFDAFVQICTFNPLTALTITSISVHRERLNRMSRIQFFCPTMCITSNVHHDACCQLSLGDVCSRCHSLGDITHSYVYVLRMSHEVLTTFRAEFHYTDSWTSRPDQTRPTDKVRTTCRLEIERTSLRPDKVR